MTMDDQIYIEEEINRINAGTAQGEQSIMVQLDMKAHNVKLGTWGTHHYQTLIELFASDMGWLEEDCFTGMEIVE